MTSQGSPYSRFQRALGTGNPLLVWAACAELPRVQLHDALAVVLVLGSAGDANFHRACSRWLALYVQQTRCDAVEADLLRASLTAAASTRAARLAARQTLRELLELHELSRCIEALERYGA